MRKMTGAGGKIPGRQESSPVPVLIISFLAADSVPGNQASAAGFFSGKAWRPKNSGIMRKLGNMKAILSSLLLLLILQPAGAQGRPAGGFNPADFTGVWVMKDPRRGVICEDWVLMENGRLKGRSYRLRGKDSTMLEWVELYKEGHEVFYVPTTAGEGNGNPVPFRLKTTRNRVYIFENPEHDFPKRIVYAFSSRNRLHAWIDDGQGKQQLHFYYRRKLP